MSLRYSTLIAKLRLSTVAEPTVRVCHLPRRPTQFVDFASESTPDFFLSPLTRVLSFYRKSLALEYVTSSLRARKP